MSKPVTKPVTKPVAKRVAKALTRTDAKVHEAVKPAQESGAVRLIGTASELGDQPQMRLLSGLLIGGGLLAGNRRLIKAGSRMLLAHELATAAKDQIKNRVDRTRPRSARTDEQRQPRAGSSTAKEETSFPSGHSAGAIAVARAFSREFPEHAAPALGAAGLVALAQIPRCAHYLTDVAAGLAVGSVAEEAVHLLWTQVEHLLENEEDPELDALEANAQLAI